MICPLCQNEESSLYSEDKFRKYHLCSICDLVFVSRDQLISSEAEKERYDLHDNIEDDQGYVAYLRKIAESIRPHLIKESRGLDFGSGKTKNLEKLLKPFEVSSYDLYFHPDESLLTQKYDFIILSEVIEHLREPSAVMEKLNLLLNTNGSFFIKTKMRPKSEAEFSNWFYKRDITHIEFFSEASLKFLGEKLNRPFLEEIGNDLFRLSNHR